MVKPSVLALFNKLNCNAKNWKQQIGYTSTKYDATGAQIVSCSQASPGNPPIKYVLGPAVVSGEDVTSPGRPAQRPAVAQQHQLAGEPQLQRPRQQGLR
jgi:hypothetical protein